MSLKAGALAVLRAAGEPLDKWEIAGRMRAQGVLSTQGKTPESTIAAAIYLDIKELGERSPFVKVGRGKFACRGGFTPALSVPQPALEGLEAERPPLEDPEPSPATGSTGLSMTDCAFRVLEHFAERRPMHYGQITQRAIDEGWLVTRGKTPAASLYAQVITEIRRQERRGARPRFVQLGRGLIGLDAWRAQGLSLRIEQHNKEVREALHAQLLGMDPLAFEELISRLLVEMGFEAVEVTRFGGDGGIDVRGVLVVGDVVRIRMAVQVKRWQPRTRVQAPVVQQVRGSLGIHEQGLIITTSGFSAGAVREAAQADKTPIGLMDGEQLVTLLMEHGLGVSHAQIRLFNLDQGPGDGP